MRRDGESDTTSKSREGCDGKEDRQIERGCRPAGEVVGTIAVTTLVAWYTLLVVHTHDPSPSLPPFSRRLCLSPELSRFLLHVRAFPPGANTVQRSRAHACTHTDAAAARSRVRVRALSPLFFSASSLASRRREPHVLSSYSCSRLSTARKSTHRDRAIY